MSRPLRGAVVLLLVLAAACGEDGGGVRRDDARQVAVYAAVIRDVADDLEVDDDAAPSDRVVFVEPLEPDAPIPIEVQAGLVLALEDEVDVAFIDDREEAIEREVEGAPVRDGAALVALGPVPAGDRRVEVEVGRYEGEDDESRWLYVVERVGDDWEVTGRRALGPRPSVPTTVPRAR